MQGTALPAPGNRIGVEISLGITGRRLDRVRSFALLLTVFASPGIEVAMVEITRIAIIAIGIGVTGALAKIKLTESCLSITAIRRAGSTIVTSRWRTGHTFPGLARFGPIANIAVGTLVGIVMDKLATGRGIAAVIGAGQTIIATQSLA